uniref:Uncharacterized protein n=1 Tax=Anopheles maculatus TaxID=74869 RepID=A0A182S8J0_9DIPT
MEPSSVCLFPSYFSNYTVLILIATSIITQLSHLSKILLMIIITVIHCYVNIFHLDEAFRNEDFGIMNVYVWGRRIFLFVCACVNVRVIRETNSGSLSAHVYPMRPCQRLLALIGTFVSVLFHSFPLRYTLSALLVAVTIALSFLARHVMICPPQQNINLPWSFTN